MVFDPAQVISYEALLKLFWEGHDPTQGMRQGNDVGTQYRSGIYVTRDAQRRGRRGVARRVPGARSTAAGFGAITTEIVDAPPFYYAEDYHQQYLSKVPERLLRPGRDGRELPDRGRRGRVTRGGPAVTARR